MFQKLFASACLLFLFVNIQSCTQGPKMQTSNDAAHAREVLETPFHFLLGIADYEPDRLSHNADMFSAWGELALARQHGNQPTRGVVRERTLRAAKQAGWKQAEDLPDVKSPDLRRYGIIDLKEDLAISKTSSSPGQNPPTRYSCRIWISGNGRFIVAAYRVDGE